MFIRHPCFVRIMGIDASIYFHVYQAEGHSGEKERREPMEAAETSVQQQRADCVELVLHDASSPRRATNFKTPSYVEGAWFYKVVRESEMLNLQLMQVRT